MITLNNGMEILQIGVGTWTLKDEVAREGLCEEDLADHGGLCPSG